MHRLRVIRRNFLRKFIKLSMETPYVCPSEGHKLGAYHLLEGTGWDECSLNNGKGFSKLSEPTERDGAYHLKFGFLLLFSVDERLELGNQMVRKFPTFRSERKKRTIPLEVVYNLRTDFPENYCSI